MGKHWGLGGLEGLTGVSAAASQSVSPAAPRVNLLYHIRDQQSVSQPERRLEGTTYRLERLWIGCLLHLDQVPQILAAVAWLYNAGSASC